MFENPDQMKLNFAQIGIGYWGPNLLRNVMENKSCSMSKVVDLSQDRLQYVKDTYPSIQTSSDLNDIFSDEKISAVIISTPVNTHFDLARSCLESGKHILVEKPLTSNTQELDQLELIAKRNNLVVMVGHTFLYNSAVRYVKSIIDSGEIGDIRYIYSQRLNLGRIRNDVDALWNLAPHDISIIQYWLDEAEPLGFSRNGTSYVQDGIDDVVFLNIQYPKNIIANIHVSWLDPQKVRKMTIVGSKKMIIYDDIEDNKIKIYDKGIDKIAILGKDMDFDDPNNFNFDYRSGEVLNPRITYKEPLREEIDHFVDCIKTSEECITGIGHARRVIEILEKSSI